MSSLNTMTSLQYGAIGAHIGKENTITRRWSFEVYWNQHSIPLQMKLWDVFLLTIYYFIVTQTPGEPSSVAFMVKGIRNDKGKVYQTLTKEQLWFSLGIQPLSSWVSGGRKHRVLTRVPVLSVITASEGIIKKCHGKLFLWGYHICDRWALWTLITLWTTCHLKVIKTALTPCSRWTLWRNDNLFLFGGI